MRFDTVHLHSFLVCLCYVILRTDTPLPPDKYLSRTINYPADKLVVHSCESVEKDKYFTTWYINILFLVF